MREELNYIKLNIEKIDNAINKIIDTILERRILGSTLVKTQLPPLDDYVFDTVIIDEASQSTISLGLLAMVKGRKWVIVGDHKQLQPIFKYIQYDKAIELSAKYSLFNYLVNKYANRVVMLEYHYRSRPEIIRFPSIMFYNERLKPVRKPGESKLKYLKQPEDKVLREILDPAKPIVFVNVHGTPEREDKSYFNSLEAEVVSRVVEELLNTGIDGSRIAVISLYRAQAEYLEHLIGGSVEVNTVDGYQGRERDVIIISLVRDVCNKFVNEEHRFNVAWTRAVEKIIVVGNFDKLAENPGCLWVKALDYYRRNLPYDVYVDLKSSYGYM
ncbi:DEAD/DEAH box helicase [Thermogladius sp. 4427co]|uniref:DEAD/DEAH box helicase n=1 Tax=Thermogladius sp. 4427co TaxID=3450718 RepID=UPI003F7AC255